MLHWYKANIFEYIETNDTQLTLCITLFVNIHSICHYSTYSSDLVQKMDFKIMLS